MAQMESRNADRESWKKKLKITEQFKENKQGFIGNNCLQREENERRLKTKEDERMQTKPDENNCEEDKKGGG